MTEYHPKGEFFLISGKNQGFQRVRQMNARTKCALQFACYAALAFALTAAGDEDDDAPTKGAPTTPQLDAEQQRALDLAVVRPRSARAPERTPAFGRVLDPLALIADDGERTIAEAQERSAAAEAQRQRTLYEAGAASLKTVEATQIDAAKTRADARLAAARFTQHWGPLIRESSAARGKLLDDMMAGRRMLVRADLLGHHLVGTLPAKAVLDVDGVEVPGSVLGLLRESSDLQGSALLIEVRNPPAGLAAGARVPLSLFGAARDGMYLPRDAVLYDESGSYVYKRADAGKGKTRYVAVKVTLLAPYGDGWLVQGVDDDDDIVVRGAGVLWSLEGVGTRASDDDEDED
jgi:hypothetical protein